MRIFNRKRFQFLNTSKFCKYILYAIGEIIIIAIGIIIALNINNWNEDRKSKTIEIKTLYEIKNGFEDDLKDISDNISILSSAIASGKIIANHLKKRMPYHDSLKFHFGNCAMFVIFLSRTGPYETLKTRGLDLISNDSIRLEIAYIYDYDYEWVISFQELGLSSVRNYQQSLSTHFKDIVFGKSATPINYEKLLNNMEFLNKVELITNGKMYVMQYYLMLQEKIGTLNKKIETEIKSLN